ncbi:Uncharacterized protein FKW44_012339, partial [Caligus rogercresseyi]
EKLCFFQSIINCIKSDSRPTILIGDLNVDFNGNLDSYPNRALLTKLIRQLNFVDVVRKLGSDNEYSWKSGRKSSRIDHALMTPWLSSFAKRVVYKYVPSSDHRLLCVDLFCSSVKKKFRTPSWVT